MTTLYKLVLASLLWLSIVMEAQAQGEPRVVRCSFRQGLFELTVWSGKPFNVYMTRDFKSLTLINPIQLPLGYNQYSIRVYSGTIPSMFFVVKPKTDLR